MGSFRARPVPGAIPVQPGAAAVWRCAERGSRDRDRQDGPTGVRVRRHRDRPQPPNPRPRGRRHHLGDRRVQVRAAARRLRDGRRRLAAHRRGDRAARRLRLPQPRRPVDPLRGPRAVLRGDRRSRAREGDAAHAGDLRRADQARADRPAHPGDQGGRRHRVRVAHAAARRAVRVDGRRSRARPARRAGDGGVGRARLEGRVAPTAQPQEVHPRVRPARDRRRVRLVLDGAAPDADRRGRRPRRCRTGPRVHQSRRARHRRAAGDRDRRRRGRPHPSPRRDGRLRARHRRRWHAHGWRHRQGRSPAARTP